MEQVLNNNNIAIPKKVIGKERTKQSKRLNKIIKRICIQIIICSILITGIYLYKTYNYSSFEYVNTKYNWIVKYNMTYVNTYNSIVNYLNNNFQFNIPLKNEKIAVIEQNENINIIENENININEEIINNEQNTAILASVGYDNMRIMAEEIKDKYSWTKPTVGTITSPFGVRDPSRPDISNFHMGIDIAASEKTEIYAAIEGEVIEASYNNVYGNYVKIAKDDIITIYAHCSKIIVSKGEIVESGEKIALMGSTGVATGSHLHFEIRKNGEVINPEYILNLR